MEKGDRIKLRPFSPSDTSILSVKANLNLP